MKQRFTIVVIPATTKHESALILRSAGFCICAAKSWPALLSALTEHGDMPPISIRAASQIGGR